MMLVVNVSYLNLRVPPKELLNIKYEISKIQMKSEISEKYLIFDMCI